MTGHPPLASRALLRLTLDCDGHCEFCAQAGLDAGSLDPGQVAPLLDELRSNGSDEVTLAGGEPTLWTGLPEVVRQARSAGFRRVGLQTNGRRLGLPGVLDPLFDAGLTDVHLSLHGGDARVHDYHASLPGSFAAVLAALSAARARGLVVAVTTVLTRSNFRVLAEVPRLLASRGASAWQVAVACDAGRAALAFDRLVPRLALALPFALHALGAARAVGLPAWISGAPLCLLGPFADRAVPEAPRRFGAACAPCEARGACAGLEERYLERFGGDEISPRPAPAPAPSAARQGDLLRLFVGTGERMPPPPGPVPAPPAFARERAIAERGA